MRTILLGIALLLLGTTLQAMPSHPAIEAVSRQSAKEDRDRRIREHEDRVRQIIEERRQRRLAAGEDIPTTQTQTQFDPSPPVLPGLSTSESKDLTPSTPLADLRERLRFVPQPLLIDGTAMDLPAQVDIDAALPLRLHIPPAETIIQAGDFRWIITSDQGARMMSLHEMDTLRRRHLDTYSSWGPPVTAIFQEAKAEQVVAVLSNAAGIPIQLTAPAKVQRVSVQQTNAPLGAVLRDICLAKGWTFEVTEDSVLVRPFPEDIAPWDLLRRNCSLARIVRDVGIVLTSAGTVTVSAGEKLPIPLAGGGSVLADVIAVRPEYHEVELRIGDETQWLTGYPAEIAEFPATALFAEARLEKVLEVLSGQVPGVTLVLAQGTPSTRVSLTKRDRPAKEILQVIGRDSGLSCRWAGPDRLIFGTAEALALLDR